MASSSIVFPTSKDNLYVCHQKTCENEANDHAAMMRDDICFTVRFWENITADGPS